MVLRPPVEPMPGQARDTVPAPGALPGDLWLQPKFDAYRALLFTPWARGPGRSCSSPAAAVSCRPASRTWCRRPSSCPTAWSSTAS
jgi:hypothetical protein